jgi:hypothetical protein
LGFGTFLLLAFRFWQLAGNQKPAIRIREPLNL